MSKRLYYADAYTTQFEAQIIETVPYNDQVAVILDQSYFYPESGGQPADRGWLDDVPVCDVLIRPADGAVMHLVEAADFATTVRGQIDWSRRFDLMQHHTGQHILSRAFLDLAEAETVGFHLTADNCTIDLAVTTLTAPQIAAVERRANEVVQNNVTVTARLVSLSEAQTLPLRKVPPVRGDTLRLVDIAGFDLTACGGTHVAQTGAVALIKILKLEKRGQKWRVEFCCGGRATADYAQKHQIVQQLTADLTTGLTDLPAAVQKLRAEHKETRRLLKQTRTALATYEAESLLARATIIADTRLITHVFTDKSADDLRTMANQLTAAPRVVALLALAGPKALFVFKRTADATGNMNQLLQRALQALGAKSGGGTAVMAQGGGVSATAEQMQMALNHARESWQRALLAQPD